MQYLSDFLREHYEGIIASLALLISIIKLIISPKPLRGPKEPEDGTGSSPVLTIEDRTKYVDNYVPAKFQQKSPSINSPDRIIAFIKTGNKLEEMVPAKKVIVSNDKRYDLIDFFINRVFVKESNSAFNKYLIKIKSALSLSQSPFYSYLKDISKNHFFFILGDTGMGKTAALINIDLKYKQKKRRYKIVMILLSDKDLEDKIRKIDDPRNTILLLDALDEDYKATSNPRSRIDELVSLTRNFRKVVFTCRTQFFNHENDEPNKTSLIKLDKSGVYDFTKIYLSLFSQKDITEFLRKKYKGKIDEFKKALDISKRIPDVSIRPLVLRFMDDFLSGNIDVNYKTDIYRLIVNNWLERESYEIKESDRNHFKENLLSFSKNVAFFIYSNEDNSRTISSEQIQQMKVEFDIPIDAQILKSKSLLHRGNEDNYKFSHSSFLEYFLSELLYTDFDFLMRFDITRFDAAFDFYKEMCTKNNTIPFIKSKTTFNLDALKYSEQREVIEKLSEELKCTCYSRSPRDTLDMIIWNVNCDGVYRFDWQLLKEIHKIKVTYSEELILEKITFGFPNLKTLIIQNWDLPNMEFLKHTSIDNVKLINCLLDSNINLSSIKNKNNRDIKFKFVS